MCTSAHPPFKEVLEIHCLSVEKLRKESVFLGSEVVSPSCSAGFAPAAKATDVANSQHFLL